MSRPHGDPMPARPVDLLGQFWPALVAPLATEVGSVMALIATGIAGIGAGMVALVLLAVLMPRLRPPDGLIRATIVLAGPPLRYILLLIAAGKVWMDPTDGPLDALLLVLVLAFLLPMGSFLIMQSRARSGG
jgi:hypothetical protein